MSEDLRTPLPLWCFVLAAAAVLGRAPCDSERLSAKDVGRLEQTELAARIQTLVEADWIDEDRHFAAQQASAAEAASEPGGGEVTTAEDAAGGCDGVKSGCLGFHTASSEQDPWWQVDLGGVVRLGRVAIYNRTDGNTAARTRHIRILAARGTDGGFTEIYRHNGEVFFGSRENRPLEIDFSDEDVTARIVRLQVPGRCSFALEEIEIYSADDPQTNVALGKPADQKSTSPYSYRGTKGHVYRPPAVQAAVEGRPPTSFSLEHTREVIARAQRLAARIRPGVAGERLDPLVAELAALGRRVEALDDGPQPPEHVRRDVYFAARRVARKIAFANPLLAIDKILFIKRHDPGGLFHMVHQYYGFCAKPGGGLFVLEDPFSENPKLTDLLAGAVVSGGRLSGQRLAGGSFLSPEVSFDGRAILFAYTESAGDRIAWTSETCYHVFRVSADGSHLEQLTDGPWNDFDPCFLPDGRIVFVSERRGGYLRCGGSSPPYDSPTYTLFSMQPDGGDVRPLSFHETHEWHPSVNHDGMIVYTRWDYVDRDTNVAHHIWTCYPDGRDPRSPHGNYPVRRESRPWMEMSIRAVPGSHRYVATAAAHHGHAFGSLVLIDPRVEDDGAMSQVERLTPDVPLPESETSRPIRECMCYGTAWPLGEDDYLSVFDRHAANRGIYWIDRDGNRELIYRDPAVSCLSPIPLCPRPKPPVIPCGEKGSERFIGKNSSDPFSATIAVMNVYDSDFAWPPETRIAALRVIQVLPKTTPGNNRPRIGVASQSNARAVLGTVPVEADGSAHFLAPVGKLIYFQALDERGMAVQSMRSGTYVHPGQRLVCQGCHEPKHRPPSRAERLPLALVREPSALVPEPEGSNPFSYVRLVQPVLQRDCVECHQKEDALDLGGEIEGEHGWSRSYANLAEKYGFYYHSTNGSIRSAAHGGSRTIAGQFGARAAPLLRYLGPEHHGVQLSPEDFRRVTLWLDANSEFYGAYHETERQSLGLVVHPSLD